MEKRKFTRYKRRLQLKFWSPDDRSPRKGVTLNVSVSGMFVSTNAPFKPGTRVFLEIASGSERMIFQGDVRYAARVDPALQRVKPSGMGVRLLRVDEVMAELLKLKLGSGAELEQTSQEVKAIDVVETADETSEEAEHEGLVFPVTYEKPHEFANTYERDIKYGGLFVAAEDPADQDENVVLEFRFEWDPEQVVQVPAVVVKKFASAEGSMIGEAVSGMGVAFSDPAEAMRRLGQVISSLEKGGSAGS